MLNDISDQKRAKSRISMAKLVERRESAGLKRVTFWATPEVQELLSTCRDEYATVDDMMNSILRRLSR